jgi:hypothetical protein
MAPHRGSASGSGAVILRCRLEECDVVSIPFALEPLVRVVVPFATKERRKLGIALQQV